MDRKTVLERLQYNPETGIFIWLVSKSNRVPVGAVAGTTNSFGYVLIGIDGVQYPAHRLAWLIIYGKFPPEEIDHQDGNTSNNRIKNLRAATSQENGQNKRISSLNTSGCTGVSWHKKNQNWVAYIKVGGVVESLGSHYNWRDAVTARKRAEARYGFHINHGRL